MSSGRWSLWVGIALVLVSAGALVVATLSGTGDKRAPGVQDGRSAPPFAVPLVTSSLEGDANVATRPNQGSAGRRPACSVRSPDVLNGCDLAKQGPAVLTFAGDAGNCLDAVATVQALAARRPEVSVAAVVMRGNRQRLRGWLQRERIGIPVGWDRDGVLGAVYDVVTCPQTTIIDVRGRVVDTVFGRVTVGSLIRRFDVATSR